MVGGVEMAGAVGGVNKAQQMRSGWGGVVIMNVECLNKGPETKTQTKT